MAKTKNSKTKSTGQESEFVTAIVGDTHSGGLTALCPPKIGLDDGGYYVASLAQEQLWAWWLDYWKIVSNIASGRKIVVIHMGDVIDGRCGPAKGSQALPNLTDQENCAIEVMGIPAKLAYEMHFVRGTPAHVGENGDAEIHIAREFGGKSHFQLNLDVPGIGLINAAHHTRGGGTAWASSIGNTVAKVYMGCVEAGLRLPKYVFRAHIHKIDDTGNRFINCRGMVTPAWQLKNAFAHKVAPESISHIGGVILHDNTLTLKRYLTPEIEETNRITRVK